MRIIFSMAVLLASFFTLSANAGFQIESMESVIAKALVSDELKAEKASNNELKEMSLKEISFTTEGAITNVFLTYKKGNGGAPCMATVVVETKTRTPEGAQGITTVSEVLGATSVCAMR